jgi:hypothetical protein
MGSLFFDADGDGDLDLYVVSGSYELSPNQPSGQDILYFNDGKGHFTPRYANLPKMFSNGSCVRAADFDGDGDLDLFVGGRVVSGAYPMPPQSYLLENHSGSFFDVTRKWCPELRHIGMVTDALWSDFDGDGKPDLLLAGEWMAPTFLRNTGATLQNVTEATGIGENHVGWWNSLVAGDFDNDGDIDYIAGNLGLNSGYKATPQEPMYCYAKDLDDNGLVDAMVFCYMRAEDGSRKPFPMTAKDDMVNQMISIRKKYPTYKAYGLATMDDLYGPKERENALSFHATDMASSYIENLGGGRFAIRPLPAAAQFAPVYGMATGDMDGDGKPDLLLAGNDYGMDPYSGRHDASMGLYLKGDGHGSFTPFTIAASGFYLRGDAKGLARLHTARDEDMYIATRNQDSLAAFAATTAPSSRWLALRSTDFSAELQFADGHRQHTEFYYGSTYLSQSSRQFPIPAGVTGIIISDFAGHQRRLAP